jgi:lecithin-cholesterol acyltransferase
MECHHFSLTDNPGVTHFELPSNTDVLTRLIASAAAPRSDCDDDNHQHHDDDDSA